MTNLQNDNSSDPIESELSSWRTVAVPSDAKDRLNAAMRDAWKSAASGIETQEQEEISGVNEDRLLEVARPTAMVASRRSWFIAGWNSFGNGGLDFVVSVSCDG